jgi:alkanesulfonate monooxygenase SsuD/methylene tetrahydromethanopterin reductase-like flavin-dependent oxidoreductase (luciferase family)
MLKFGLAFPYGDAAITARYAQLSEECSWDGVFIGDAIWCVDPMVVLTAAAMKTSRICLGTMVIPVPLRRPWKIASEAAALDNLSGGRLILGLGTGATWMGWQGFPDEVIETRARAEMLDETIDILTLLFQGRQFDFDGKHYHLKLTQVDPTYYPRPPLQQPRIPLWCVGVHPKRKSMERILKCDGWLPNKMNAQGEFEDIKPEDVRAVKTWVTANRALTTPFDIVIEGKTRGLNPSQTNDLLLPWVDAGATWWIDALWEADEDQVLARIRQGPPIVK